MQKRLVVEKYSDFLKKKIDPEISNRILALNNDKDFKERGISIVKIDPKYENPYNKLRIPAFINDYLKDIGSKRVFCLFRIHKPTKKSRNSEVPEFISIGKIDDKIYDILLYKNVWVDFHFATRTRSRQSYTEQKATTIEEILEIFKSMIPIYDEERTRYFSEIEKNIQWKNNIKKRSEDFAKKYNRQFILDEFSNVFDLCKSYEISKIETIRSIDGKKAINIKLFLEDTYDGDSSFLKMNRSIGDLFDEISVTHDRLREEGLDLIATIKDRGILIRLIEILPEKTNEGVRDVFKKNPVDAEIAKEVLDLNNSERFKKNKITIEKIDLEPSGKFIFKYTDKAAIKNMISFKATLPEAIRGDYRHADTKEFYIFIRQSRKTPTEDGEKVYNMYVLRSIPSRIDWVFDFHGSDIERGYLVPRGRIYQSITNIVCTPYERHIEEENDRKQKESHLKSFFEKFDEQYIKDIFADILSLCPGEIRKRRSSEGFIGGFWLLKVPIKAKKDTVSQKLNHVYDDIMSEIFEEMSVARDRLKDDGLVMSFDFERGSLSINPTLYIIVRDKIKQDEEDYIPEPTIVDGFP